MNDLSQSDLLATSFVNFQAIIFLNIKIFCTFNGL